MSSSSDIYLAQSTTGALRAVMGLAISIPTVLVLLRCYVRGHLKSSFGVDDAIAVLATVRLDTTHYTYTFPCT